MAIRCANCGSAFTNDELVRLRPPRHPWPLTAEGHRVAYENQMRGTPTQACPKCGNPTLVA